MKYRLFFTLLFLFISGFSGVVFGQGFVSWRDATKEPISRLVVDFGKVADLNYTDEDTIDFGLTEKRENLIGINKFKRTMVLAKEAADSSLYRSDRIINFIDTTYIRMYNEIAACENQESRDSLIQIFVNKASVYKYISMDEYIEKIRKIYNRDNISDAVLPGIASNIETSVITDEEKMNKVFIAEQRHRVAANKWMTKASANLDFIGYYLDKDNQQQHVDMLGAKFIFDISFDEVKTSDGKAYTNYRIEKVTHPLIPKDTIPEKYLFTVQPFVSGGLRSIASNFSTPALDEAYHLDNAMVYEAGVIVERKMRPFGNSPTFVLSVGTGFTFTQFVVNSYLSDNYIEQSSDNKVPPFTGYSDYLKQYTIKSAFDDVSFRDVSLFVGIPLRLGIEFKLDPNNKVRGYLNSGITYSFPVNSKTNADGVVDQTGVFVYEFDVDGISSGYTVEIGGEGNPLSEYYGKNNAFAEKAIEWKGGITSKTELGINFGLKRNSSVKIGPYFSIGSYQLKNPSLSFLAEESGRISSPLSAMNKKVSFTGYGLSLSLIFDVYKLSAQ